jgi:CRP/FNR family cyclic AMP-dependent transcriptional regulator
MQKINQRRQGGCYECKERNKNVGTGFNVTMSAKSIWNTNRRLAGRPAQSGSVHSAGPIVEALKVLIAAQPFFDGMKKEYLQTLAGSALEIQFASGEVIFREGDLANRFYLIQRGKVAVEVERRDAEPILLQTLGPGREVGWSWILPPFHEQFTARVLEPTTAIFFYGTQLREQCEANHDLGYELMSRMAVVMLHRIQATRCQLLACHVKRPR